MSACGCVVDTPLSIPCMMLSLGSRLLLILLVLSDLSFTINAPGQESQQSLEKSFQAHAIQTISSRSSLFSTAPLGFYHFLGDDWITDFHIFGTLLPPTTAAATLQSFYEDVAYLAATTAMAPGRRYLVRVGQIDLEIRSNVGDVPFAVVIAFANSMRELTTRGFTNVYQVNFIKRATGRFLTMSLWIGTVRWG